MTEGVPAPAPAGQNPPCEKCRMEATGEPSRREIVEKDQGFELKACTCAGKDVIWRKT